MQVAPVCIRPSVCALSAARCRYVNSTWPWRSIAISDGCGSFTFTIKSAVANASATLSTTTAPAARYESSAMPMPAAALCSTVTLWPCNTSSRAPAGVRPTRYSCVLISLGTPICTCDLLSGGERELGEVRHIVIVHVNLEGSQHANHSIIETDGDRQVDDMLVAQRLLQCGECGVRHCTIERHLAGGAQYRLRHGVERRRLAGRVVDKSTDVVLADAEVEAQLDVVRPFVG